MQITFGEFISSIGWLCPALIMKIMEAIADISFTVGGSWPGLLFKMRIGDLPLWTVPLSFPGAFIDRFCPAVSRALSNLGGCITYLLVHGK
jgi:hypothetical protein